MAASVFSIDYVSRFGGFLLTEYVSRMQGSALAREEQLELRRTLEYFIAAEGPEILRAVEDVVRASMQTDGGAGVFTWYLELISGKSPEWLRNVNPAMIAEGWSRWTDLRPRRQMIESILLVEFAQPERDAKRSAVTQLFREHGVSPGTLELTADGSLIATLLIRPYRLSPVDALGRDTLALFSIRILRECLRDEWGEVRGYLREQIFRSAGELGERRGQIEQILNQPAG